MRQQSLEFFKPIVNVPSPSGFAERGFVDDEHPLKYQGFVAQRAWLKAIPFLRAHLDSMRKQ